MKRPLAISKTDFKTAQECRTKLYYRMLKYPSNSDGDAYMDLLAKGGYMIGAIASLQKLGSFCLREAAVEGMAERR